VGTTKPGHEIFDITFEMLGKPPKDSAVIVGDRLSSDIRGGADYGIATCWYNPNGATSGPTDIITHEIKSLAEVRSLTVA
jgi:FMN phosphatase YigB (HAD superfamily)